jgi:hypothetical protein
MNPKQRDATFLVRMWMMDEVDGDAQWRGSVLEVTSGTRFFITQPRDIADFIAAQIARLRFRKG